MPPPTRAGKAGVFSACIEPTLAQVESSFLSLTAAHPMPQGAHKATGQLHPVPPPCNWHSNVALFWA